MKCDGNFALDVARGIWYLKNLIILSGGTETELQLLGVTGIWESRKTWTQGRDFEANGGGGGRVMEMYRSAVG